MRKTKLRPWMPFALDNDAFASWTAVQRKIHRHEPRGTAQAKAMTIGDRVFWPGIADGVPMIRSGFIEGRRGPKFRICDDSGIRFTKSVRALYSTRAAADAALHRLLLRKP